MFCLRRNQQLKAEHFLKRVIAIRKGEVSVDMHILFASLYLQRKDYHSAKRHIDSVLDQDWTNLHANLLFGFLYNAIGWKEMSRKYFAIAKVQRMRDLQLIPAKS